MPNEKIKYVAYNPATRRYEEIYPEDETLGESVICLVWSDSLNRWVSIPQ